MAEPRVVYGRPLEPTSVATWVAQRVSGLALAPMVALHVALPALGHSRWFLALFLACIAVHGYTGLNRLRSTPAGARHLRFVAALWTIIVVAAGGLVVLAA